MTTPGPLDTTGSTSTESPSVGPQEIAPRIWWVGTLLDDDFQCHPYLVEAGSESVLIDPGSALTVDATLDQIARVVPLEHVRWLVCLHSDPDVAGAVPELVRSLPNADLRLVTEWRSEALLRHYGPMPPVSLIEDLGWVIPLGEGRELRFVLTPYLHFPGALVCYETGTGTLFSSDLFGGFSDGNALVAPDLATALEAMRPFHEHYMPSREILAAGLDRIRRSFGPVRTIAPQHGYVLPEAMVPEAFDRLRELECGIFLVAHDDPDVAALLRQSSAMRRLGEAAALARDLPELASSAERILPDLLPVASVAMVVELPGEGHLRFSSTSGFAGEVTDRPEPASTRWMLPLPGGPPRAWVEVGLDRPADVDAELVELFHRLEEPLRLALDRHLHLLRQDRDHALLEEQALRDRLTGLYNRHVLDTLVDAGRPFGVLMVDIDRFKAVNDLHGHAAGDAVLRAIAETLREEIRPEDLAVRYGGEEFLVLLPDVDQATVTTVAERLRRSVASMELGDEIGRGVTVSIGASLQQPGDPLSRSIGMADQALYAAKEAGRDQVVCHWG